MINGVASCCLSRPLHCAQFFSAGSRSGDFPGFQYNAFLFSTCIDVRFFFCGEIMPQRQEQQQQQQQQQCTEHATTNSLQRYNVTAPSSSSQHHERATAPRCTVSSCFAKHVRSVAHHIYSYQLFLGCCFYSASFGTKLRHSRTQQPQCKEHATTSIPIAPSSRQRHARVTDTRCTRCTLSSCFVEPEFRHQSHASNSLLDLCSAAEATS